MALICKFASDQSKPEKIERFIDYLDELKQSNSDDPHLHQTISQLESQAQRWLTARY